MTRAGWKWAPLALIAAGGVAAFAIYTLGWHDADAGSDGKTEVEQAEAIGAVRLRAKGACEAPWWEDDYCVRRVKATRFTAEHLVEGVWRVREHVRGDQPFQDICWLVEPKRLPRPIDMSLGWTFSGLWPASCTCPRPSNGVPAPVPPDGRELGPGGRPTERCPGLDLVLRALGVGSGRPG
jgi:hypothetical protein